MLRRSLCGWATFFVVAGVTLIIGTEIMAPGLSYALKDPFSPVSSVMLVSGQTFLMGLASAIGGVVLGIYGLIFGRSARNLTE